MGYLVARVVRVVETQAPTPPASEADEQPLSDETLEFLYDEIERVMVELFAAFERVEAQTLQLLTGGSLVLGLAGFSRLRAAPGSVGWILVAALIAYSLLAASAVLQVLHRTRWRPAGAQGLWAAYRDQPPSQIRYGLIEAIAEGVESPATGERAEALWSRNVRKLRWKTLYLRCAVFSVTVETALVGVALALRALG